MSEFEKRQIAASDLTFDAEQFPKLNEPDSGAVLESGTWYFEGEQVSNANSKALDTMLFAMDLFALKCGYYLLEMVSQNVIGNRSDQKTIRKGYLCKTLLEVNAFVTVWEWQLDPPVSPEQDAVYKSMWVALYKEFKYEALNNDDAFKLRLARKKAMADDWGV